MFDKKDITICKALKHHESHRNGVIQAIRNKDSSLSFVFKKRIKGSKRNPLGLLITKYSSDSVKRTISESTWVVPMVLKCL